MIVLWHNFDFYMIKICWFDTNYSHVTSLVGVRVFTLVNAVWGPFVRLCGLFVWSKKLSFTFKEETSHIKVFFFSFWGSVLYCLNTFVNVLLYLAAVHLLCSLFVCLFFGWLKNVFGLLPDLLQCLFLLTILFEFACRWKTGTKMFQFVCF